MSIPVVCPKCSAKLNAPDGAAGKTVRCPKCQAPLAVPAPESEFEVIEEAPPERKPPPKPAGKPLPRAVVVEEDDEEQPRRKRPRAAADEDEERPRKKQWEDDDGDDEDDDQPRKKKKKKQAEGNPRLARNIVGGVVLLVLLGVAGWVYYEKLFKEKKDDDTPSTSSSKGGDESAKAFTPKSTMPAGGALIAPGGGGGGGGGQQNVPPPQTLTGTGFKVTFPGQYQSNPQLANTVLGKFGLSGQMYIWQDGSGKGCAAMAIDVPAGANAEKKKEHYESVIKMITSDGSLVSRLPVTVKGRNWEELRTRQRGGPGQDITRVLQTDKRVYLLASDDATGDLGKQFFESFELTN